MGQVQPRLHVLRLQLEQLLVGAYGGTGTSPPGQLVGLLQTPLGGAGIARWELRFGSQESRVVVRRVGSREPSEIRCSMVEVPGASRQSGKARLIADDCRLMTADCLPLTALLGFG